DGTHEDEDDDDDGDQCDDLDTRPPTEYWPYPNKSVMLLDVLDNLPRCRFSSTQMSLIIHLLKEFGAPEVPSLKYFRKLQTNMRSLCGSDPAMHTGTIARDFSNPTIAQHLHLYPEEVDGPISETWQAERWKEYDPSQLTPMFSKGFRRFWIEELAQLKDGTYVIPHSWIVRHGILHSDASRVVFTPAGWKKTEDQLSMRKLVDDDEDLYVVMVSPWADDVSGNRSKQYNKHMNMYAGNGCLPGRLLQQEFHVHYVFSQSINETTTKPFKCFNAATQRNCRFIVRAPGLPADNPQQSEESCHMGANANFPCRKCGWGGSGLEKESEDGFHNCHFAGIARDAETIREALRKQLSTAMYGVASHVEDLQTKSGTKDSITQHWIEQLLTKAKEMRSSHPEMTPDDIAQHLQKWLEEQPGDKMNPLLDIAGLDPSQDTPVELLHTILLGVIKYIWHLLNTQWSDSDRHLLAIRLQSSDLSGLTVPPLRASYMIQYRNNLIGKHFKTLMQILAFHVHDITTPEQFTLIKAAGELSARLWVPEIDNMADYLSELEIAIANVLDAFDAIDPLRILVKIKLHLLTHIVDDVRRFGPGIRFSTEIYEAYNAIFRLCSIYSNHQAPSRDISFKFASMERVKHLLSGGYVFDAHRGTWVQAGDAVLRILRKKPIFQRHLGWTPVSEITAGHIVPQSLKKMPSLEWCRTRASASSTPFTPPPAPNSIWRYGKQLTTVSGDKVSPGSWVFARQSDETVILGRIAELLLCVNDEAAPIQARSAVLLERFVYGNERHPEFDWPILRRPNGEDITEHGVTSFTVVKSSSVLFVCSVQHDCRLGHCRPTVVRHELQERQETNRIVQLIAHSDDDHFVLNVCGLHNFVQLCRTLPRELTKLKPLYEDRKSFHNEVSKAAREIRSGRRKDATEKRRATAQRKKEKVAAAIAAAAEAVLVAEAAAAEGVDVQDDGPVASNDEEEEEDKSESEDSDDDEFLPPVTQMTRKGPSRKSKKRKRTH
ncbi:hypothetical protein BDZ89DRAFT_1227657, partial [Hymenopellis radicata]